VRREDIQQGRGNGQIQEKDKLKKNKTTLESWNFVPSSFFSFPESSLNTVRIPLGSARMSFLTSLSSSGVSSSSSSFLPFFPFVFPFCEEERLVEVDEEEGEPIPPTLLLFVVVVVLSVASKRSEREASTLFLFVLGEGEEEEEAREDREKVRRGAELRGVGEAERSSTSPSSRVGW
jgi:hypothetical protein